MMFLLRCAFWLSVVYASIFWSHGAFFWTDERRPVTEIARSGATSLMTKAATATADFCASHRQQCLADAARLVSLLRLTAPEEAASAPFDRSDEVTEKAVPLPVPDPRRRFRDAKLSRAP